jgi:hypothetical protein
VRRPAHRRLPDARGRINRGRIKKCGRAPAGGSWKLELINTTGKIKQGDEHALMRFAVSK